MADARTAQLAASLPHALGPMFRLLRRAVAVGYERPRLPGAQIDVLRLVEGRTRLTVTEAAEELQLATNTVSTLVGDLEAAGLVERRRRRSDRRVTELHLTDEARERLAEWGRHRQQVLEEVLGRLPTGDRAALEAALPALERLRDALADRAGRG